MNHIQSASVLAPLDAHLRKDTHAPHDSRVDWTPIQSEVELRTVRVDQYRVRDPVTGRRYLTSYKLTKEEAAKQFPGDQLIECIEITEETRTVYDPGEITSSHQLVFGRAKET